MKIALLTTDNREHYRDYANPRPYFGTAPEALLQGFAGMPDLEVHVVSCLCHPVRSPEKLAPNIYYHGLVVPKMGWMRTLYRGCVRATRAKLREIRPDIVHGQGTERDCAMAAVRSGFPNVLTIHGNMQAIAMVHGARFGSFHWLASKLETLALKKTAGVFCNSAYTEDLVAPRTRKTWRVPNPLRLDFFAPVPKKNPGSKPIILNVGVIDPRKRQVELLEVARRLHECGLNFEFQFAGGPPAKTGYGATFTAALAPGVKAGYARHLGPLPTSQLIKKMDAADALVHFPSEEAFGLVVAEALARNLKLFGARLGGILDITRDIPGVELFPSADFNALEAALARWLSVGSPPAPAAASLMQARYHPEIIARRHLDIYREVLPG